MDSIKIFLSDSSEQSRYEREESGYASDVLIFFNNKYYLIPFISISRINTEFKWACKTKDVLIYTTPHIVVKDTKEETIVKAILNSITDTLSWFKPVDIIKHFKNSFPELQDIKNWHQIF